jgi:hypothetical protein
MAYLPEEAAWEEGIRQLETADPALAGEGGVMNLQAVQLGNRTAFLKGGVINLQAVPTSLQTTDPPTFVAARITVKAGGAGYAEGDAVTLSEPPVAAAVGAVDENGGITAISFNAGTVYADDPSGADLAVSGGGGEGAVCDIRTAYAPGDEQADGELIFVPYGDPLVQTSRMRGYVRDYLDGSGIEQRVTRLDAMRKWSPSYLYAEGDVTYAAGRWYEPNPEDIPIFGESPVSNPEKWIKVSGGSDEDSLQIAKNKRRIDLLWNEIFGEGITFTNHFALDFYTLEGVNLEEGVWRDTLGRVEV